MFDISFYVSVHNFVILIVLALGSNIIFVIIESWRQSNKLKELRNSRRKRFAYTLRKSVKAVATSSITTFCAFAAHGFSNVLLVKAFGIYVAIIIPVNTFLICSMVPPMIIFHDIYI